MTSNETVCLIPSLATSLEPLVYSRNVASLNLFFRHYFDRCSSERDELLPLPHSHGRSTRYSNRLQDFPVTIPGCYNNVSLLLFSSFSCNSMSRSGYSAVHGVKPNLKKWFVIKRSKLYKY